MPNDNLEWFEAAMGAVSKINADVDGAELIGARCPKCDASEFVKVADLYYQTVGRLEDGGDPQAVHTGAMTDLQIVQRLSPPRSKSVAGVMIAVAIPLAIMDFYAHQQLAAIPGQAVIVASLVLMVALFMTMLRRFSDQDYRRRRRWNSLFICRRCGQLVASSD